VGIYCNDAAGAWQRCATLDPASQPATTGFGRRVALGHRIAAVGSSTRVELFQRKGATWSPMAMLLPASGESFTGGLAFANKSLLVGVFRSGLPSAVSVFREFAGGLWRHVQTLTSGAGVTTDLFGLDLAIDAKGKLLVVGAPLDNEERGAAYLFRRVGKDWILHQKLIAMNGTAGDRFGISVAIDGRRLAVGAPGADTVSPPEECGVKRGVGYVFMKIGANWFEQQSLHPYAFEFGCVIDFGWTAALQDDRIAFGGFFSQEGDGFSFARVFGLEDTSFVPLGSIRASDRGAFPVLEFLGHNLFVGVPFQRDDNIGSVAIYDVSVPVPAL
jgi:hypothetical protein